ncbi:hypothetical protein ABTN73_20615, partial [Acinetobacter baumannii]
MQMVKDLNLHFDLPKITIAHFDQPQVLNTHWIYQASYFISLKLAKKSYAVVTEAGEKLFHEVANSQESLSKET